MCKPRCACGAVGPSAKQVQSAQVPADLTGLLQLHYLAWDAAWDEGPRAARQAAAQQREAQMTAALRAATLTDIVGRRVLHTALVASSGVLEGRPALVAIPQPQPVFVNPMAPPPAVEPVQNAVPAMALEVHSDRRVVAQPESGSAAARAGKDAGFTASVLVRADAAVQHPGVLAISGSEGKRRVALTLSSAADGNFVDCELVSPLSECPHAPRG